MRSKIFFITVAAIAGLLSIIVAIPTPTTYITLKGNNETNQMVNIELRDSKGVILLEKDRVNLPLSLEIPSEEKVELAIYNNHSSVPSLQIETEMNSLTNPMRAETITLLPISIYTIQRDRLNLNTALTYDALSKQLRP